MNILKTKKGVLTFFLIIVFFVFLRSLFNPYVYDSTSSMEKLGWNREKMTPVSVLIDSEKYCYGTGEMSYRPVSSFVYMVMDARFFGFQSWLSHGFNLLLHAFNGFLLYLLLVDRSGKNGLLCLFAVLVFLLHPLVSETVLCIGFREDILALCFVLSSLLIYKYFPAEKWVYLIIPLMFLLAFFSKEIGIILVPLLPLYIYLFFGSKKQGIIYGSLIFILFVLFFAVWKQFQYSDYTSEYFGGQGRITGMVNFLVSFHEVYLSKFFLPHPLRIDYAFDPIHRLVSLRVMMMLFALVPLLVLWFFFVRKSQWVLFGGAWIFFSFLPLSQIIPVPDPVAERFCYVPMVGVSMMVFGLLSLIEENKRKQMLLIGCTILVCLGTLTARRCWDWQDEITLNIRNWEMAEDQRPVALRSLGALYLNQASQKSLSEKEREEAFSKSYHNLELLLVKLPGDFEGNRMMSVWYLAHGQRDEAEKYYFEAKKIEPHSTDLQRLDFLFQEKSEKN